MLYYPTLLTWLCLLEDPACWKPQSPHGIVQLGREIAGVWRLPPSLRLISFKKNWGKRRHHYVIGAPFLELQSHQHNLHALAALWFLLLFVLCRPLHGIIERRCFYNALFVQYFFVHCKPTIEVHKTQSHSWLLLILPFIHHRKLLYFTLSHPPSRLSRYSIPNP